MTLIGAAQVDDIAARHPAAFRPSIWKRFSAPLAILACILYTLYCWWFFSVGAVLQRADWAIGAAYLKDWISYEIRPDVKFGDGRLDVKFPRFSPLGENPNPDWITREYSTFAGRSAQASTSPSGGGVKSSGDSFMAPGAPAADGDAAPPASPAEPVPAEPSEIVSRVVVAIGDSATIEIVPGLVTARRGAETLVLDVVRDQSVTPRGTLPAWASQKAEGAKVLLQFGFAGRVEVEEDEVKIRRRFLGWANFVFDPSSPFWGKPAGEVVGLIVSGDRIIPGMSNAALAWNNILNNSEGQHGDVWLKLLQTIVMAFVGTVLATVVAFPLSFLAARNITPNRFANQFFKRSFDFLRSVDMLIWALFFTRAFGPGPLAGMSAIFFTDTGTLGKLYAEALENIDDRQREGVRSVGAAPIVVQRYGVVPQVLPIFLSQSLYFWESNTRSATIIGAVGAGGIGLKLWEAMRTGSNWENVAYMVLLILAVVFIFDTISSTLRRRLISG
jgi:phosphonate transport system permease protein